MRSLLLALQLLTRIPIRIKGEIDEEQIAHSVIFFPTVGAVVGGIMALAYYVFHYLLPAPMPAFFALLAGIVVTGALHQDGLMDTADGVFSGRPREDKLKIMKDSRVGAMGVTACIIVLLGKLLLINQANADVVYPLLVLTPILGRSAMIPAMMYFPYAGLSPGVGSPFARRIRLVDMLVAELITLAAVWVLLGQMGCAIALATGLVAFLNANWLASKLGGLTGDTYGFVNEISELVFLILVIAAQYHGLL